MKKVEIQKEGTGRVYISIGGSGYVQGFVLVKKELTALTREWAKMQGYKLLKKDDAEWLLRGAKIAIDTKASISSTVSLLFQKDYERLARIRKELQC